MTDNNFTMPVCDESFPLWSLVRFGEGYHDIMCIRGIKEASNGNHTYVGDPCVTGTPEVVAFHQDCTMASVEDRRRWQSFQN
ncbi:MAG: hypothetical protein CL693_22065 [Cellvibrionaceae bacterium]|jgi:hypothetical protein|nr:hypothetical protein [Cellvibrionaceae bacterium]|tara:strand:+ start:3440 stop:3685 length:246 start_codon:yes stop_codon:yes gene_type:complete